jgi:glycosyltransferase involved in cell wall biosynthesis
VKPRILFLIRSLGPGGAERQLVNLARSLRDTFHVAVCTLYKGGALDAELLEANVPLYTLDKVGRWDVASFTRLHGVLRDFRPDILHGYMGIANELALAGARLIGAKAVWGVRSSFMDLPRYGLVPRASFQLTRMAAPFVDCIILNSYAGMEYYVRHGYPRSRMVVVPNGIDVMRYRPNPEGRARLRASWGISPQDYLIGLVARMHPIKDHETFLRAVGTFCRNGEQHARFVCVGGGSAQREADLRDLSVRLGIDGCVVWSGDQTDMTATYSALDVCTLTSYGEGFPNSLAEAMACGTHCVSTDAGDARQILGPLGVVVPPRQPDRLAAAWRGTLLAHATDARTDFPAKRRARVVENFSMDLLRERTTEVLLKVHSRTWG